MFPGLIIRSSSIHAAGCYTTRPIKSGVRICEYDGPRMSKAEADDRYEGRFVTYLFACGDDLVIDGFGTAMFLNHCCDPNCETEQDENGRIYISSIRDIAAGEELTYEYNLHDSDEDDQDCYCGVPQCRNTMLSDYELKRRARNAKRKAQAKGTIEMIDVTFNLSRADFSEAHGMWCPKEVRKLPGRAGYQIFSVIFGCLVGFSFQYLPLWLTGALSLSIIANLIIYLWRKKAIKEHQFIANSDFMEDVHVQINETEYRSDKSEMCGSWIAWNGFTGWQESKNVFVLGHNLSFVALPKAVLSGEQQSELRSLLQSRLGPPSQV